MAVPVAAVAKTALKKLTFDFLADPEKVVRRLIIVIVSVLLLLVLLIAAPIALITSLPSIFFDTGSNPAQDLLRQQQLVSEYKLSVQALYDQGIQWVTNEEQSLEPYDTLQETKDFNLSWIDLIAIDSVRFNQTFTNVTPSEIDELAKRFLVEKAYKQTYTVWQNNQPITQTRAVIIFSTVSLSAMFNTLGFSDQDKAIATNIENTLYQILAFPGQSGASDIFYPLAYANAVTAALAAHNNISQILYLALITHESGGNWDATNQNSNGTLDAGLSQINSTNWANYGLSNNPYDVMKNLNAGMSILSQDIPTYGDEVDALYAYNGGTPSNGRRYNPTYAPAIEGIKAQLETGTVYADISYTQTPSRPISLIVAERNGATFVNPPSVTVTDARTQEVANVMRTTGDGSVWAPQAAVYPIDLQTALQHLAKGDSLTIRCPDGQTATVVVSHAF